MKLLKSIAEITEGEFYDDDYIIENFDEVYQEIHAKAIKNHSSYDDYFNELKEYPDNDEDGIPDYFEGKLVSGTGIISRNLTIDTDPTKSDTDGDGLLDGEEVEFIMSDIGIPYAIIHSNPREKDSDFDGYNDYDEVRLYSTDPFEKDFILSQADVDIILDDSAYKVLKDFSSSQGDVWSQTSMIISGAAFGGGNRYEIYIEGLSEYLKMLSEDMKISETKNKLELSINYLKSLRSCCYEIINTGSNLLIDAQNCIKLIDVFLGKTQNYNWHNYADENMYELNRDLNDVLNGLSNILKDNADLENVLSNKFSFSYNAFSKINSFIGIIGKVDLGLDLLSDGINNLSILSNIKSASELVDEYILTLRHIILETSDWELKLAVENIIEISENKLSYYCTCINNIFIDNAQNSISIILNSAKLISKPALLIFESTTIILNGILNIDGIVRNTNKVRGLVIVGDALRNSLSICFSNTRHISSANATFYDLGCDFHDYRMKILSYFDIRICAENAFIALCQNNFGTALWWLSDKSSECISSAESRIRLLNTKKSWYFV